MKRPILTMAIVWLLAGAASVLLAAGGPLDRGPSSPVGIEVPDRAWAALEASAWIRDGRAGAPRVVYAFTDPNCPYCSRFWHDARPWVDAGDPAAALLQHERDRGKGGGVKPAAIDPSVSARRA